VNATPKLATITVALGLGSCGIDSAPRIVPVAWPYVTKNGRYEALRVGDGLGGWGCGFEYTLLRIDNSTAGFGRCGDPSRTRTVRVGDRLKIQSFHGDINATILAIEDDVVRVLIPEQPFIIEPAPPQEVPMAVNVPGRPDLVVSPYTGRVIDISGSIRGSKAYDPTTSTEVTGMKQLRVPGADLPNMPNKSLPPTGDNPAISNPKALGRPAAE
jgi:hypothetical protein